MGRSVSTPSRAATVHYAALEASPYECHLCETTGKDENGEDCFYCDGAGERPGEVQWEDFIDNLKAECRARIPGLTDCDEWPGREDHAILEHVHGFIGVSEYCGMVAVWTLPREVTHWHYGEGEDPDADEEANADWAVIAGESVAQALDVFATRYWKRGTFSNGEAVYLRVGR